MADLDEKLSVLLDDYNGDGNADAAIDAAVADVNLQYRMRRYRMIGEVMRNEMPRAIDTDFHASVMSRVRTETAIANASARAPAVEAKPAASWFERAWLRPVAGLALAASVAIVTVAVWQPEPAGPDGIATVDDERLRPFIEGGQAPVVRASTNLRSPGTRWKVDSESAELQQKLNAYLVNHTEHSNSVQGLIPQARVAGFDTRQQ